MGIVDNGSYIKISGGYGDYDSFILSIEKNIFLSEFRHDISNLNMNDYDYKLIVNNKIIDIDDYITI